MLSTPLDPDTLYAALLRRDTTFDGLAYVGVTSTGIFCRLTCPARKPRRENTRFFVTAAAAQEAGFRPCRRCRPLAVVEDDSPMMVDLVQRLERRSDKRWSERDLVAMGLDPSTVRRAFRKRFGLTFLAMARRRRLARGLDRIASGASVIDAQLDAMFDSASGFRAAVIRTAGRSPTRIPAKWKIQNQ